MMSNDLFGQRSTPSLALHVVLAVLRLCCRLQMSRSTYLLTYIKPTSLPDMERHRHTCNKLLVYENESWRTSTFRRNPAPGGERETRLWLGSDQLVSGIAREMTLCVVREVFLGARHVTVRWRHQLRTPLYCITKFTVVVGNESRYYKIKLF